MSKKRKRNNREPASRGRPGAKQRRDLGPPPTGAETLDITKTVFRFAELVADGKPTEAVDAVMDWVGNDARSGLRSHYIAITAPVISMGLICHHFPVELAPDALWIMERAAEAGDDAVQGDAHAEVMCQVLVRLLNDDQDTAHDLLAAHLNTYGEDGLFWVGVNAIKCLAGIILAVRNLDGSG